MFYTPGQMFVKNIDMPHKFWADVVTLTNRGRITIRSKNGQLSNYRAGGLSVNIELVDLV